MPTPVENPLLGWLGSCFRVVTSVGLGCFAAYVALGATGATFKNFEQWQPLLSGLTMPAAPAWMANVGIGLHFTNPQPRHLQPLCRHRLQRLG